MSRRRWLIGEDKRFYIIKNGVLNPFASLVESDLALGAFRGWGRASAHYSVESGYIKIIQPNGNEVSGSVYSDNFVNLSRYRKLCVESSGVSGASWSIAEFGFTKEIVNNPSDYKAKTFSGTATGSAYSWSKNVQELDISDINYDGFFFVQIRARYTNNYINLYNVWIE